MSEKIQNGWKWVKLGEVVKIKHGYAFPGKNITNQDTGKVLVTPGNFNIGGGFKSDKLKFYSGDYPKEYELQGGEIIVVMTDLSKDADILGYSAKIPTDKKYKYLHNQRIGLVEIISSHIDKDFIYWLMRTTDYHFFIVGGASGTSVMHTSPDRINEYSFPLPPLPEQKAIAEVLSSIDDKIDLLHRQNKTLEEMAMTLFRQWFIEPTKDGLPEGWEEGKLGDSELSKIIPSGIKEFEGFKTYLATGDIEGTLIKGGVEITYNNRPSRANMQPEKYSVWFAKKEGVRKLLMFDDYSNIDKYILSTGFTGLKTNELSHYYIWCFILHEDFQDIKDSLVSGSVQPDIPNEAVSQIFIPRPPDEVLLTFNKKVKPLFTKIQFNTSQIQTLEKLRDTLLPKLMSGEVRVKIM